MKKVITAREVDLALRTLGPDELLQVRAWLDHLSNWDNDPYLQQHSHSLPGEPGVFVLFTNTDIRIFFSIADDTIKVLEVAKKQAIATATAYPRENR